MTFKRIWQAGLTGVLVAATAGTVAVAADSLSGRDLTGARSGLAELGNVAAVQLASEDERPLRTRDSGPRISVQEAIAAVEAAGYSDISEVEREGPDYEVKARDADGRRWELYVDGRTGEIYERDRD